MADGNNARIQRWAPGAASGTTIAGGNGAGSGAAQLNFPGDLKVDASGNFYTPDLNNHRVRALYFKYRQYDYGN